MSPSPLVNVTLKAGFSLAAVVVLLTLSASAAMATIAYYVDLDTLSESAEVIVQGKVLKQTQRYDAARKLPLLITHVDVSTVHKGKAVKGAIEIQQIGGTHEGLETQIPGDALFTKGEEVVLFLTRGKNKVHYLTSMAQSKFTVTKDGANTVVIRDMDGLAIMDRTTNKITPAKKETLKKATFELKLKAAIKKSAAKESAQ